MTMLWNLTWLLFALIPTIFLGFVFYWRTHPISFSSRRKDGSYYQLNDIEKTFKFRATILLTLFFLFIADLVLIFYLVT